MKNVYLLFLISIIFFSCTHKHESISSSYPKTEELLKDENIIEERDSSDFAQIKFDYYEFDAGNVFEGPRIKFEFPFTNIGEIPLVIQSCKSSCGCVIPICEDRLIFPGERGVFKAEHWTKGHTGGTRKTITMSANTDPQRTVLRLKANILPAEMKDFLEKEFRCFNQFYK